jgi:hypothetical protein
MPFLTDVRCQACNYMWEVLLDHKHDQLPNCPKCEHSDTLRIPVGAQITKLNSFEARSESLKKRSADHTLKGIKKIAGHKGTLPPNLGRKGCQID